MQKIRISDETLCKGTTLVEQQGDDCTLKLSSDGGGFLLPQMMNCKERYLSFYLEAYEEHSIVLELRVYTKAETDKSAFTVRFGILPKVRTAVCIDRNWMNAHILFPEPNPGELKLVCHGRRVEQEEIERITLEMPQAVAEATLKFSNMILTEEYPTLESLPDGKFVDEFGQNKRKQWKNKINDLEELTQKFREMDGAVPKNYPFENWSEYGGWKEKKLGDATGYFTKCKLDGRWWLVDPLGYAFFSMGPDCVSLSGDCRVDGIEKWLDWLPDKDDQVYGKMFRKMTYNGDEERRREGVLFSYLQANLYRVFGDDWYENWKSMITGQLRRYGMNTLGNWTDARLLGTTGVPYVTSLPQFPTTAQNIFRDFPDVLSEEYKKEAEKCAQALESRKEDPLMIGYFLRNEPAWAFVDNLVLADEVLYNPARTVCKEKLVEFLQGKYENIENLNQAYGCSLKTFDDFYQVHEKVSTWSDSAKEDMKEFSRRMLRAYVEIPCKACRQVDPNHMILGMRWAWISDPDLVTGWENFDVFSINCYAVDPTANIQNAVNLGVDLPVMIGEFHFGALDAGLYSTGLEGVASQKDRGIAYRYYCERVAAHPNGVGCHYFQCYDQFVLGRFDGENYNIGLFDICSQPYPEMLEAIKDCSENIYQVADAKVEPVEEKAVSIPMVAF